MTLKLLVRGGRDFTDAAKLDAFLDAPDAGGAHFCPVGFFVPDWWDVHDGSIIPGSEYWRNDHERPTGDFGFVWGCVWGDDGSWKVQYLDLSQIHQGVVRREERFGYSPLPMSRSRRIRWWRGTMTTIRPHPLG